MGGSLIGQSLLVGQEAATVLAGGPRARTGPRGHQACQPLLCCWRNEAFSVLVRDRVPVAPSRCAP